MPWWRWKVLDDLRGLALARMSPVSTNTQVRRAPIALCTSAAATAESTPPESPQRARPSPTCARIAAVAVSMIDEVVQSASAAHVDQEALEQPLAALGVRDLRVELHPVEAPAAVLQGGDRDNRRCGP